MQVSQPQNLSAAHRARLGSPAGIPACRPNHASIAFGAGRHHYRGNCDLRYSIRVTIAFL